MPMSNLEQFHAFLFIAMTNRAVQIYIKWESIMARCWILQLKEIAELVVKIVTKARPHVMMK